MSIRDDMALRFLNGESVAKIAKELKVHPSTVVSRVHKWVASQPWFKFEEFSQLVRQWGNGYTKTLRELYKRHRNE